MMQRTINDIAKTLGEVYDKGSVTIPNGHTKTFTGTVSLDEALEIASKVVELRPEATMETGVAYGLSTLAICLALKANGKGIHYGADPDQRTVHEMAAVELLRQHEVSDRFRLLEGPAHKMLPGVPDRIQFAFVDGWHTFDCKLIDFFLTDKLLDSGGVVGFHDCQWASTQRVLRFALSNRKYRLIGNVQRGVFNARNYTTLNRLDRLIELQRRWQNVDLPLRRVRWKNLLMLEKLEQWEPNCDFYGTF
jgi:predicted O-methyltransferase YrrM